MQILKKLSYIFLAVALIGCASSGAYYGGSGEMASFDGHVTPLVASH